MTILLNPRMPQEERTFYEKNLEPLQHHTWLVTSGTSGKQKFVALSDEAILTSAKAVNEHLQSTKEDVWVNPLPHFHVGGLGIKARASLSGAKVIDYKQWDPHTFTKLLHESNATLTALVPTQVYDLKINNLKPPKSLRAVIVGGGAFPGHLYDPNWPFLPSYGLTECSSQVATAKTRDLIPLNHIQIKIEMGFICIKSPSLLTTYAWLEKNEMHYVDPKQEGWFQTEDRGALENGILKVLGRSSDFVKIGGESVDLSRLKAILDSLKLELKLNVDVALYAVPDPRLGHVIHLATTSEAIQDLIDKYQEKVLPYEKIRKIKVVEAIPRTPLGKVMLI